MKNKLFNSVLAALIARIALGMSPVLVPSIALAAPTEATAEPGPQDAIATVSTHLFQALDANRAAIQKNPDAVVPIVDKILLPQFDVDYAAQLVLARHWSEATPEQRAKFIHAFYGALVRTYASALADATADRLKILPFRGDASAPQVTVRTEVKRSTGTVVPVDYRLHKTADGWKAFDVVVEGISYVRNYRTDFDAEISARGLDALTSRIETQGLGEASGRKGG